jgi:hypothetical protein
MPLHDELHGLLQLIQANPTSFDGLTLGKILHFITCTSHLRDDILLTQPTTQPATAAPDVLPPSVATFLGAVLGIPQPFVDRCWTIFRNTVWDNDEQFIHQDLDGIFRQHGLPFGISTCIHNSCNHVVLTSLSYLASQTLYPPQHTCPDCSRDENPGRITKSEQRQAVLYTLDRGAIPVYSVHLYCDSKCRSDLLTATVVFIVLLYYRV